MAADLFGPVPAAMAGARELLASAQRDAILSRCGKFRYWLMRRWGAGPRLLFVMLNPSTADAEQDDATIRRCVTFAALHGFQSLAVVNLFAYRATDPADLKRAGFPVGSDTDSYIASAVAGSDAVCAAWGAVGDRGPACDRVQVVVPLLRAGGKPLQCLKVTRSGHPQHPLYLPSTCRLQGFDAAITEALEG